MSELIKSILVFQEESTKSTSPFCTLGKVTNKHRLPCLFNDDIMCSNCIFATGHTVIITVKAMERVCEKPK